MLIKYSQNYNLFVFVFNSTEVGIAASKIFCVMIPSLVYTCCDIGLFRVVKPCHDETRAVQGGGGLSQEVKFRKNGKIWSSREGVGSGPL